VILIDRKVGSRELSSMFHQTGIPAQLDNLPSGDFVFMGNGPGEEPVSVGIERKVVMDFLQSFMRGRLNAEQLPKLCEQHHYPYLLLEGDIRPDKEGNLEHWWHGRWIPPKGKTWTYEAVDHILTTITTHWPVRLIRTSSDRHTVATVVSMYKYFQVPWESHESFKGFHTPPPPVIISLMPQETDSDEDWQRWICRIVAKELPGVGWARSEAVAEDFNTARRMVMADEKRWREIEGIGPKTAARVMRALGGF
jgi:ERCC4-type nuclease